jgi:hypothetical protein
MDSLARPDLDDKAIRLELAVGRRSERGQAVSRQIHPA